MRQITIEQIKQKAVPILKAAGIKHSSLFGSYVRGEQHEKSDIDILVKYPSDTSLFDVVRLKHTLEDSLERPVDLVSFKGIKPRLKPYILSEQMPIL